MLIFILWLYYKMSLFLEIHTEVLRSKGVQHLQLTPRVLGGKMCMCVRESQGRERIIKQIDKKLIFGDWVKSS